MQQRLTMRRGWLWAGRPSALLSLLLILGLAGRLMRALSLARRRLVLRCTGSGCVGCRVGATDGLSCSCEKGIANTLDMSLYWLDTGSCLTGTSAGGHRSACSSGCAVKTRTLLPPVEQAWEGSCANSDVKSFAGSKGCTLLQAVPAGAREHGAEHGYWCPRSR